MHVAQAQRIDRLLARARSSSSSCFLFLFPFRHPEHLKLRASRDGSSEREGCCIGRMGRRSEVTRNWALVVVLGSDEGHFQRVPTENDTDESYALPLSSIV